MLSQDERKYLAGVFSRAKALREVFNGNGARVDDAREGLSRFIDQPGRLLDLLRRCDRLYGFSDHMHRRLDWAGTEWERFPRGSGAVWDWLGDVEVLADLERCLERNGKSDEDLRSIVLRDFDRFVFEEVEAVDTRVGIEYLVKRLPGARKADHPDAKTVRISVNRLCALGLLEDSGGRNGIAVAPKGRMFARLTREGGK